MRILGVEGFSIAKRVGNLAANASGVRSRCVLVVDCVGLVARSVAPRRVEGSSGGSSGGSSITPASLAESIILSPSLSKSSRVFFSSLLFSSSFCR